MTLSVDIGGTFTDFVLIDDGVKHFKIRSTPFEPEKAFADGLGQLEYGDNDVFHGTTVATNAVLEGKGVETAFITNKGFEDILFIGRQDRPRLYDLHVSKPKPPIKVEHCFGISGRMDSLGKEIRSLDIDEVEKIAHKLSEENLCAAVCLLHSYENTEHEIKVGEILDDAGVSHTMSHKVSREFREYERGMTTLLDAYLSPIVKEYFSSITNLLGREPYIMKSSGGLEKALSVDPIDTFYSGPAGGVAGGLHISKISGKRNVVTFDMGGTSSDMATIIDGEMDWKDTGEVETFPVQSRMVDIVTVGSGGGSIARCDEGGVLRVGPKSAGADPGPVCYGRGGNQPTITDALLVMGYINPNYFLGGKMDLDKKGASESLKRLAEQLGMELEDTLLGIFKVANSNMARTMKTITVERGLDPKQFSILAFGGAGPLHAAYLGMELNMSHVMIPPLPGVFSALGIATGDIVQDYHRTMFCSLSDKEKIEEEIEAMNTDLPEGSIKAFLGLRYKGQGYHINVENGENIAGRFHRKHKERFGYAIQDSPIEVVRIHLEVRKSRDVDMISTKSSRNESQGTRNCLFPEGTYETRIFYRSSLGPESEGEGPTIIEDKNSTILVPPNWSFWVDQHGIIHMERNRGWVK
ncbi:MAG: hydantoinase/oxoprolinase family protein [Candidatus Saliniplasma sp.]